MRSILTFPLLSNTHPSRRLEALLVVSFLLLLGCTKEEAQEPVSDFPEEIHDIIAGKCSVSGCHNQSSYKAAAGLSLESWNDLMLGANNGNASVIPFAASQSPLFFFVNSDESMGPALSPNMPYNAPALSKQEVKTLVNWINRGAPNATGELAFQAISSKHFVLNSLCNLVSVIDGSSGLITRYIELGEDFGTFPEVIRSSPANDQVYVLAQSGQIAAIDSRTDHLLWKSNIGSGWWRSLAVSQNGGIALATDYAGNSSYNGGRIAIINLHDHSVSHMLEAERDSIYFPYGVAISKQNIAYVSCYKGNFVYQIDLKKTRQSMIRKIILDESNEVEIGISRLKPSQLEISQDQKSLYVLCEGSNEVRKIDLTQQHRTASLSLPSRPFEICLIEDRNLLMLSCTEDQTTGGRKKGAVYAVDLNSLEIVKRIYTGYQPRGLSYDEKNNLVYVANRNADPLNADQPHHYTDCDGNNGYLTAIDLANLELTEDYKAELSVEPYAIAKH